MGYKKVNPNDYLKDNVNIKNCLMCGWKRLKVK